MTDQSVLTQTRLGRADTMDDMHDGDDEDDGEEGGEVSEEPTCLELNVVSSGGELPPSANRDALSAKISAVKEKLTGYIHMNSHLEDDDLEKLTGEDFIIDLAQQQAWREEGSRKVETLKQQVDHRRCSAPSHAHAHGSSSTV